MPRCILAKATQNLDDITAVSLLDDNDAELWIGIVISYESTYEVLDFPGFPNVRLG